ncbi:MAG: aspartate-semialdehyde dehydrogenase [Deltaproteobacteria bacterium]|nr:MAG: aspartate-semialdehyde dehydrogenase [Deltaproteobacteria bacterium]
MLKVGFIGWRGMVGSVLMGRMKEEQGFNSIEPLFFSTSEAGSEGPDVGAGRHFLNDAYDIDLLSSLDIIITCQGGEYTRKVYPEIRKYNWDGYWIDAASTLRMEDKSIIVLDPVNRPVILKGLSSGIKTYVGGNCTVSLMLMAISGLLASGHVEWISSMTYQAASGAGAKHMKELISQMRVLGNASSSLLDDPASTAIAIDNVLTAELRSSAYPVRFFGAPLAGSLIPWIDTAMDSGQTREEWKGNVETNKILQTEKPIPVDGLCVRVGSMRCHSQALTIKLDADLPLNEISNMIENGNEWVKFIPNDKESTLRYLTPAAVNGFLTIPVGRLRKLLIGPEYITLFTVGDQLLWGAAEPVRRILQIIIEHLGTRTK